MSLLDSSAKRRAVFAVPAELALASWVVVACFALSLLAAYTLQVDKIVQASGVLETPLGVHEVRNMVPGHVRHIHVAVGQSVKRGDLLVEFDGARTELELMRVHADMDASARKIWAEAMIVLPQLDDTDRTGLQARLAAVRKPAGESGHALRLQGHTDRSVKVFDADLRGAQSRLRDLKRQHQLQLESIAMQQQENERAKALVNSGFESPNSLLARQRALVDAQAREAALLAEIQALNGVVARLGAEHARHMDDLVIDLMRRLDEQFADHQRARIERELLQDKMARLAIKAPFDAVVDAMHLRGPSEYLPENSPLLQLRQAMDEEELVLDIVVAASQAIWIKPGMRFRATPAGNSPDDHGSFKGEVSFVSQSSQPIESVLNFRAKGRITRIDLPRESDRQTLLRPGTQLRVDIVTGQRRLLSYVLDPLQKSLREAAREPG